MNLPNKISINRICMIPVFIIAFFLDGVLPFNYAIAAIIFALAACTDFIDGYIARSRGLVTNLGKFLDPIADKVLVATAMILLLTMWSGPTSVFSACGAARRASLTPKWPTSVPGSAPAGCWRAKPSAPKR